VTHLSPIPSPPGKAGETQTCFTMANICINRFYCSTDNEANYEKILYGLGDRFDLYDLDGRDNWMRGEFDSKWCYPEEAIAALMKTLEKDPTLHIEIVSCEPGMQYLEAHIYDNGMWNSF